LLGAGIDHEPVRRLTADPLPLGTQVPLRVADPGADVARPRAGKLSKQSDRDSGAVVRRVESVHHRDEPSADAGNAVESGADLPDALAGEPVELPDQQRADDTSRDGCQRGVEALASDRLVAGAPTVNVDLAHREPVKFRPRPAVGFLALDGGLAVPVQRQA
jgi:hypothetical protein